MPKIRKDRRHCVAKLPVDDEHDTKYSLTEASASADDEHIQLMTTGCTEAAVWSWFTTAHLHAQHRELYMHKIVTVRHQAQRISYPSAGRGVNLHVASVLFSTILLQKV